jgi:hypothetical protein
LILDYLEQTQVRDLWNIGDGCFYDIPEQIRQLPLTFYQCPSQAHDEFIVPTWPADGHSHGAENHPGALSDYQAVTAWSCTPIPGGGSTTCEVFTGIFARGEAKGSKTKGGPISSTTTRTTTQFLRYLTSYNSCYSMRNVTDGTSNTMLFGEVSRRSSEGKFLTFTWAPEFFGFEVPEEINSSSGAAAFNGDTNLGRQVGINAPLALAPTDTGFGSAHPGVVHFCFGDGSVRALQVDMDPLILDAMASRDQGEVYSEESAPACPIPPGGGEPPPIF